MFGYFLGWLVGWMGGWLYGHLVGQMDERCVDWMTICFVEVKELKEN